LIDGDVAAGTGEAKINVGAVFLDRSDAHLSEAFDILRRARSVPLEFVVAAHGRNRDARFEAHNDVLAAEAVPANSGVNGRCDLGVCGRADRRVADGLHERR
jgi:hypothetical protein